MTSKTNAPQLNGATATAAELHTSVRAHMQRCKSLQEPQPLYIQSFGRKCPHSEGGGTKRTDRVDSVTLIAAEEDSDIISRQLLSVSFHFSVVLSSPSASLSYIKPHSSSSRSNKTARRLIVGEVSHVARCLSCFIF